MTDGPRQEIGARIRRAREAAGLSQGQAAKRLEMHRPTISEIEAGRRRVSADEVAQLADLYGTSAEWITTGKSTSPATGPDDRLALVARELGKMSDADLDRLMGLLEMIRAPRGEQ
ncbi:MAG: helix-turn-helix transcriptional regulator [Vicinamibacterales bacterium]